MTALNPVKRTMDIVISLALAIPALAITLLIAPFVWWETRASPIFEQRRVGRDGRTFTMLKLRTMRPDTPDRASHEVGHDAITRTGRLMRRTKIDELPQLWNVLTGDMSLVGPRPCLPAQVFLVEERRRLGVERLRPGVTGLAQLMGLDMSQPIKLAKVDATYLDNWSIGRDLKLLMRTVAGKGSGDAAVVVRD
jgi:lipopolysaccharide/colanic/teichoic acid biosynthesis glycosyltransferase